MRPHPTAALSTDAPARPRRRRTDRWPVGLINERDLWDLIELFDDPEAALRYVLAWTDSWQARMDDLWAAVVAQDDASTRRQVSALLVSGNDLGAVRLVSTAQGLRTALDTGDESALRRHLMVLGEVGRQTMSQVSRVAHTICAPRPRPTAP